MTLKEALPEYIRWEDVPDNLKTKTALGRMGLKPARGQQPAAIKKHWHYSKPDYLLFDVSQAVPKRKPSEAQQAAIKKAQAASLAARTCRTCGLVEELGPHYRGKLYLIDGLCPACKRNELYQADQQEAISWARDILAMPAGAVLILDTETTGLEGEIIELAIIDLAGNIKFNSRFRPLQNVEPGAAAIHGITTADLENEPTWAEQYEQVKQVLKTADVVLIYNAAFDTGRFNATCQWHGVKPFKFRAVCLMEWYAQFYNDWSEYWGNYKWQPLYGDHSALGDCQAALALLKNMAAGADHEA